MSGVLKTRHVWKAGVICWLKTRRPCGTTPAISLATHSPHTEWWRLVSSDNRVGAGMQADIYGGWGVGGGLSRRVRSTPGCYNGIKRECAPPHQDLNRAVTVTASLPSLQGCCLPKGSAVTYICQALLALSASENHFSLNFIAVYLRVFSSFVWFELWAPSRGFDEGNVICSGGGAPGVWGGGSSQAPSLHI